jgi:hypothetical protein
MFGSGLSSWERRPDWVRPRFEYDRFGCLTKSSRWRWASRAASRSLISSSVGGCLLDVPVSGASTTPSLMSSDAQESSSSSSVSVVPYSDEEFDTTMPRLGTADGIVVVAAMLGTLDTLGAIAPFMWRVWAFACEWGSTGARGGREDPVAFGAALSGLRWNGGRGLVGSLRTTCAT